MGDGVSSEDELQSQLRLAGGSRSDVIADCAGASSEVRIVQVAGRIREVRMIENVEQLSPELHSQLLRNLRGLREGEIHLFKARSPSVVTRSVAILACCRRGKRRSIELTERRTVVRQSD